MLIEQTGDNRGDRGVGLSHKLSELAALVQNDMLGVADTWRTDRDLEP